jgi:hypothetical protein
MKSVRKTLLASGVLLEDLLNFCTRDSAIFAANLAR